MIENWLICLLAFWDFTEWTKKDVGRTDYVWIAKQLLYVD